jgi:hypothetical protein
LVPKRRGKRNKEQGSSGDRIATRHDISVVLRRGIRLASTDTTVALDEEEVRLGPDVE